MHGGLQGLHLGEGGAAAEASQTFLRAGAGVLQKGAQHCALPVWAWVTLEARDAAVPPLTWANLRLPPLGKKCFHSMIAVWKVAPSSNS